MFKYDYTNAPVSNRKHLSGRVHFYTEVFFYKNADLQADGLQPFSTRV